MLIQDLSKELDAKALSAVHGGNNGNAATNAIGQQLGICAPAVVVACGPANTNIDVTGTQNASIDNFQFAGDSFMALLPVAPPRC
jgi:hypothetical protein